MGQKPRATVFDRDYFDKWYRSSRHRVHDDGAVRRAAALAVGVTEYLFERPIRRVLDIGCGEGAWRHELRKLRPGAAYVGLDPSGYAVKRFGARRNIRAGSWGTLATLKGLERFDLVVCSDVLHYVEAKEVERGARVLGRRLRGVAFLHAFTGEDEVEGDTSGYMDRPAQFYRRVFRAARLTEAGLGIWVSRAMRENLSALELPRAGR